MFDLVLFAYSVRCLLEYRVSKDEFWLLRAAVVYAAAATDTWVMILLFPAFVAAIVWMKGLGFFHLRFLARLFLCFAAGMLFYFYLPLLHLRSNGSFWVPLKENFSTQFHNAEFIFRYTPHYVQLVLIITSLLPIFVISIRWRSSFGDTSQIGAALATWIFHVTHFALMALCIWAAFDPAFSLRDAVGRFPVLYSNRDAQEREGGDRTPAIVPNTSQLIHNAASTDRITLHYNYENLLGDVVDVARVRTMNIGLGANLPLWGKWRLA